MSDKPIVEIPNSPKLLVPMKGIYHGVGRFKTAAELQKTSLTYRLTDAVVLSGHARNPSELVPLGPQFSLPETQLPSEGLPASSLCNRYITALHDYVNAVFDTARARGFTEVPDMAVCLDWLLPYPPSVGLAVIQPQVQFYCTKYVRNEGML